MEGFPHGLQLLAAAGIPLAVLVGVLAGCWLGFRVATRDAALLGRFATDAQAAKLLAEAAEAHGAALRDEWSAMFDRLEAKRRSASAAVSKREQAEARAAAADEAAAAAEQAEPIPMEGRARRTALQKAMNRGGAA